MKISHLYNLLSNGSLPFHSRLLSLFNLRCNLNIINWFILKLLKSLVYLLSPRPNKTPERPNWTFLVHSVMVIFDSFRCWFFGTSITTWSLITNFTIFVIIFSRIILFNIFVLHQFETVSKDNIHQVLGTRQKKIVIIIISSVVFEPWQELIWYPQFRTTVEHLWIRFWQFWYQLGDVQVGVNQLYLQMKHSRDGD